MKFRQKYYHDRPTGVGKQKLPAGWPNWIIHLFKSGSVQIYRSWLCGRDVESIIRDLVELSVNMIKSEEQENVCTKAAEIAEEKLLDLLLPQRPVEKKVDDMLADPSEPSENIQVTQEQAQSFDARGRN